MQLTSAQRSAEYFCKETACSGVVIPEFKGHSRRKQQQKLFHARGKKLFTHLSFCRTPHPQWVGFSHFSNTFEYFFNAYVNYISNCNCAIRISLLMALCVRSIYLTERCLSAKTERQKHTWSSSAQSKGLPIIIGINPFHSHLFIFGKGCIRSHS